MIFKVSNKSNFRGQLKHKNLKKQDFLLQKIGVNFYTGSTYTTENMVLILAKSEESKLCSVKGKIITISFSGVSKVQEEIIITKIQDSRR